MTQPVSIQFRATDLDAIAEHAGRVVVFAGTGGATGAAARRINRLTRGALDRFLDSQAFEKMKAGDAADLAWPAGLAAEALQVVKLDRGADVLTARKAGATIGKALGPTGALVLAEAHPKAAEISYGIALRAYDFVVYRTGERKPVGEVVLMCSAPEAVAAAATPHAAVTEGVFFARDLTNEPANVLNPTISPRVWPRCRTWAWMSRSWTSPRCASSG